MIFRIPSIAVLREMKQRVMDTAGEKAGQVHFSGLATLEVT